MEVNNIMIRYLILFLFLSTIGSFIVLKVKFFILSLRKKDEVKQEEFTVDYNRLYLKSEELLRVTTNRVETLRKLTKNNR